MFVFTEKDNNVLTFMTDRKGGVSTGAFSEFNLGLYAGDEREAVVRNREILAHALQVDPSRLLIPKEVHGDHCVWVDSSCLGSELVCDALITSEPNLCLCVTTADCVPVLLYDERQSVCAAVHAGWKGVVQEILPKTIGEICHKRGVSPSSLRCIVNPCISLEKFEVGEEVVAQFRNVFREEQSLLFIHDKGYDKPHIDLRQAVALQAIACGVQPQNLKVSHLCTFQERDLYSARRDGFASGRMVSGVMIREENVPIENDN